jgi:uncharacterized protein (DUF427 family)
MGADCQTLPARDGAPHHRGDGRREHVTEKTARIPGPDHPITIDRHPGRIVVTVADKIIADSTAALTLREASYPAVQYIPRADVDMAALARSGTHSYCPYKGEASYFSIPAGGDRSIDAIWTYEAPYDAVADIRDHLAFYASRVDTIEERAA